MLSRIYLTKEYKLNNSGRTLDTDFLQTKNDVLGKRFYCKEI